jgi:signal transduction histidine kinase
MTVNRGPGTIVLTIQDDGRGFDHHKKTKEGLGLLGIEERVRELSGDVSLVSQPRKGTLLRVEIPVPAPKGAA